MSSVSLSGGVYAAEKPITVTVTESIPGADCVPVGRDSA